MSHGFARGTPRWSVAGQEAPSPIAALPFWRPTVSDGPPLLCNPPKSGSPLRKPAGHVESPKLRLWPPSVTDPPQLPAFRSSRLFCSVALPAPSPITPPIVPALALLPAEPFGLPLPPLPAAPAWPPRLPASVTFRSVAEAAVATPPPTPPLPPLAPSPPGSLLPVPPLPAAPPSPAVFETIVLLVTDKLP